MSSVTRLVFDTIALELGVGRAGEPPTFTLDDLVSRVWRKSWKALQDDGYSREDLRVIAGGVWRCAEACLWPTILQLVGDPTETRRQPEQLTDAFKGGPDRPLNVRAGMLTLPSGSWAWIAPERGDFIHVCFQHLERRADRMEGAIRGSDFSTAAVERIARDPSIRWWTDPESGESWELRTNLGVGHGRDVSFTRMGGAGVSATDSEDGHLGEYTDEELHRLLEETERVETERREGAFRANSA